MRADATSGTLSFHLLHVPPFPPAPLPALPPLRRGKWLEMVKARVPSTLAPIMPAKGKTGQDRTGRPQAARVPIITQSQSQMKEHTK